MANKKAVLDDKRIGLLLRMDHHRTCVCSKRIQEPLLRRGFTEPADKGRSYRITQKGRDFINEFLKDKKKFKKGVHIETWAGISISNLVFIVSDGGK